MKFYTRLAFYLFGLLIGVIFMIYFMTAKAESRNVAFCYFPNCRVLKDLRSKPFYYSEQAQAVLEQKLIDTLDIKNCLTDGQVNFSLSNKPHQGGKLYVINYQANKTKSLQLKVVNYKDKVMLLTIKQNLIK